tara:strand:- start:466 stop:1320 length:855 start_codon:yes stop_codon:yes gene_type:complete
MKRMVLVSSKGSDASNKMCQLMENILSRALIPFWSHASTVSSLSELKEVIDSTPIDLILVTDLPSAREVPISRELPALGIFLDEQLDLTSSRIIDDLELLDLIFTESEIELNLSNPTIVIGSVFDVEYFDPRNNERPREYILDFDIDDKMLVLTSSDYDLSIVKSNLPKDMINDLNFMSLVKSPSLTSEQIVSSLQHSEVLLISEGQQIHPLISNHAMAAGCPIIDCRSDDPRKWSDKLFQIWREWIRAGKVPRHPDEDLIKKAKIEFGLEAFGSKISSYLEDI